MNEVICSVTSVFISIFEASPDPVISLFPDWDDAIRRGGFAGIGRPKGRKGTRSEDRQYDDRYEQRIVRFHTKILSPCLSGFHDASGGFSDTTQGWIATLPSGRGR